MVIKEWKCGAHGTFEAAKPICPRGCTAVSRVFLTAPGVKGDKTKQADANFKQIAADFGLTNMQGKPGEAARIQSRQQRQVIDQQKNLRAHFAGALPKGGTYEVGRGVVGGGANQGAFAALAAHHAPQTDVISQVKPMLGREIKNGLIIRRDPDRDSVAKVKAA